MSGVVLEELRNECRQRWKSVSPFRLGSLVGERGLVCPNPYPNPRGQKIFNEGVEFGNEKRSRVTGGV